MSDEILDYLAYEADEFDTPQEETYLYYLKYEL